MYDQNPVTKKITATVLTLGVSLLIAAPALAASFSEGTGLTATAGQAGLGLFDGDVPALVGRFIGALISLLGIVFVVLLIYGGFTWMTAQGAEDKIKKAKGIITSAVIGLVVISASYAIAQAVIGVLVSSTAPAAPTPP